MKNKLGTVSLIFSFLPSIVIFFAVNLVHFMNLFNMHSDSDEEIYFLTFSILLILTLILFIAGNIIAIRALLLKEESKVYPILSIIILYFGTIIFFFFSSLIYTS